MMSNLSLQFGSHNSDVFSVLALHDAPLPAEVPAGSVRVEIKARAINPADIFFVQGLYDRMVGDQLAAGKPFQTGGSEGSGVIVALGAGAPAHLKVGQRVYVNASFPNTRIWANYVDAAGASVVPIPDNVSFSSAAQLLVNPLTAIGFLDTMVEDGLQKDDIYVLTAGNSALCKMVLQLVMGKKKKMFVLLIVGCRPACESFRIAQCASCEAAL